jgi:hypothetical protein
MELSALLTAANIHWGDLYIDLDAGTNIGRSPLYSLMPRDFLMFAKADLGQSDLRGLINSISNAKRAIDCQTDYFVSGLGLDPDHLQSQLGKENLKREFSGIDPDQPTSFKLLAYLGIIPPTIVQKTRKIRNVLEHEYKKPSKGSASNAIDVAELYVGNCEGLMKLMWPHIILGSEYADDDNGYGLDVGELIYAISLWLKETQLPSVSVRYWDRTDKSKEVWQTPIPIASSHPSFLPLLKLIFAVQRMRPSDANDTVTQLLRINGVNLGKKRVRIKEIRYA